MSKASDHVILRLNAQREIRQHHQCVLRGAIQLMRELEIVPHERGLADLLHLPEGWTNQQAVQHWLSTETCAMAPEEIAAKLQKLGQELFWKLETERDFP